MLSLFGILRGLGFFEKANFWIMGIWFQDIKWLIFLDFEAGDKGEDETQNQQVTEFYWKHSGCL